MKAHGLILVTFVMLLVAGCAKDQRGNWVIVPRGMPTPMERVNRHLESNPQLSPEVRQAISEGSIIKGMTREDVLASWGNPWRVYEHVGGEAVEHTSRNWMVEMDSSGNVETWIYGELTKYRTPTYLYFQDGYLVGWAGQK